MPSFEERANVTYQDYSLFNLQGTAETVFASVALGIVIFCTAIGNVFVIYAIIIDRVLRRVANYLVLSLATADLILACVVMPVGALYAVTGEWTFGPQLCEIWTSADVLCCTASILHLLAIAIDRYWAVTHVDYIHQRDSKLIGRMIIALWAVAIFISLAPIFGFPDPDFTKRLEEDKVCLVSQDIAYQIIATCSSFYAPLVAILFLYWKIYKVAKRRIRHKPGNNIPLAPTHRYQGASSLTIDGATQNEAENGLGSSGTVEVKASQTGSVSPTNEVNSQPSNSNEKPSGTESNGSQGALVSAPNTRQERSPSTTLSLPQQPHQPSLAHAAGGQSDHQHYKTLGTPVRESIEARRERRAAKTLAIITGVFVICWLPFFIVALIMPLCGSVCTPHKIILSFILWLGWANSMLNPIIYTIFSPDFRAAFKRILFGRKAGTPNSRTPCNV